MSEQPEFRIIPQPAIHLIYGAKNFPNLNTKIIVESIKSIEDPLSGGEVDASWAIQERQRCLGKIQIDQHHIQVAGLSNPIPDEIIDCTVHTSPWGPQIKAVMRQHRSHISLVYTGNCFDPVEKMIALYKAAHALTNEDLSGILNENAWTAHPPADFLSPEKILSYRQELPIILWVGYVKFFTDEHNYWYVTKGHHIFDVPDLAFYMREEDDLKQITLHFNNLFFYISEEDVVVTAGDTLEIARTNQFLRFRAVPEDADFLMGPSGTLVIEKIDPKDVEYSG